MSEVVHPRSLHGHICQLPSPELPSLCSHLAGHCPRAAVLRAAPMPAPDTGRGSGIHDTLVAGTSCFIQQPLQRPSGLAETETSRAATRARITSRTWPEIRNCSKDCRQLAHPPPRRPRPVLHMRDQRCWRRRTLACLRQAGVLCDQESKIQRYPHK